MPLFFLPCREFSRHCRETRDTTEYRPGPDVLISPAAEVLKGGPAVDVIGVDGGAPFEGFGSSVMDTTGGFGFSVVVVFLIPSEVEPIYVCIRI